MGLVDRCQPVFEAAGFVVVVNCFVEFALGVPDFGTPEYALALLGSIRIASV